MKNKKRNEFVLGMLKRKGGKHKSKKERRKSGKNKFRELLKEIFKD